MFKNRIHLRIFKLLISIQVLNTGYADALSSFLTEVNHVIRSEEGRIAQQSAVASIEEAPAAPAPAVAESVVKETVFVRDLELLTLLREKLDEHYRLDGELRVHLLRSWKPRRVSSHDWDVELVKVPADSLESVSLVRFRLLDRGISTGEHSVTLRCEHWLDVWHTTLPMVRQQEVVTTLLEPRRIDTFSSRRDVILASKDLSEYEFRQAVGSDRALTWRDVSLRPHVRRGDEVDVLIKRGSMEINMRGMALENGIAGESIAVRNLTSNKNFQARVIANSSVRVYL